MSELKDPGMRAFVSETTKFYPPDAVDLTIEEQRDCYNRLCAHFLKPRPDGTEVEDGFGDASVARRRGHGRTGVGDRVDVGIGQQEARVRVF